MAADDHSPLDSLRVAVLCGGDSAERAISLQSGHSVCAALAVRGHAVTPIDPSETFVKEVDWTRFDAAFLALHGKYGEDGQIQAELESLGIPYTGSDAVASRLAFSKSASKERFIQEGVPTPAYVLIHESDDAARIQEQARKLGYPLAVKPDAQGSSLGVTIVENADQLPRALTECFHYDSFGLLETAIEGTEWTLGVVDGRALPLIQIQTSRPFFDFRAKYEDDETRYLFEFPLPTNVVQAIEQAGLAAAGALGTSGIARVDLRLDRSLRPWVLEVNTIPGFTSHSLIPKSAARAGIDFGELCERTLSSCLQRAAMQQQRP